MSLHELNILAVFRNDGDKLHAMPDVSKDLFLKMAEFLHETIQDCKVLIGDRFISGTEINLDSETLTSIFAHHTDSMQVEINALFDSHQIALPYSRFDGVNNRNYIGILPVIVESDLDIGEFVKFTDELLIEFGKAFDGLDAFALGFGKKNGLFSLFEKDFDCLFSIAEALGVSNESGAIESHETIQTETDLGIYVIPHFPLSAIAAAYGNSNINIVDRFTERLRVFRATTTVMDILEKKYVVIRGMYRWLSEALAPSEAKMYLENPLGDVYEETLISTGESGINTNTPVKMDTFNDSSAGTLCSVVNWSNDDSLMMLKVVYPVKHDSDPLLLEKHKELMERFQMLEHRYVELDGSNESLLTSLFERQQKLLGMG